jgi:hypothetical protein
VLVTGKPASEILGWDRADRIALYAALEFDQENGGALTRPGGSFGG